MYRRFNVFSVNKIEQNLVVFQRKNKLIQAQSASLAKLFHRIVRKKNSDKLCDSSIKFYTVDGFGIFFFFFFFCKKMLVVVSIQDEEQIHPILARKKIRRRVNSKIHSIFFKYQVMLHSLKLSSYQQVCLR